MRKTAKNSTSAEYLLNCKYFDNEDFSCSNLRYAKNIHDDGFHDGTFVGDCYEKCPRMRRWRRIHKEVSYEVQKTEKGIC